MDNQDILTMLCKIDNKVDSIANELNKSITQTAILQERIFNTTQGITEIKTSIIPSAIKEAVGKSKNWVYGSIGAGVVSIIITILLKVL